MKNKEKKLQKMFASDFFREKTNLKVFKSLLWNVMKMVEKKNKIKKSVVQRCEFIIRSYFVHFRKGVYNYQLKNNKRKLFYNVILKMDKNNLIKQSFNSLKENTTLNKIQLNAFKGILKFKYTRRILNNMLSYSNYRKQTKKVFRQVSKKHKVKQQRNVLY